MAKLLEPIHPDEILRTEYLLPLEISINRLARDIGVPPGRISEIVNGKHGITADTALRLERYFKGTPELWMELQTEYDLRMARRAVGKEIEKLVRRARRRSKCCLSSG